MKTCYESANRYYTENVLFTIMLVTGRAASWLCTMVYIVIHNTVCIMLNSLCQLSCKYVCTFFAGLYIMSRLYLYSSDIHLMNRSSEVIYLNCMHTFLSLHLKFRKSVRSFSMCARFQFVRHILIRNKISSNLRIEVYLFFWPE